MIGWWIIIELQLDGEQTSEERKATVLGTWNTSVSGIDWLMKLTREGQAIQTNFSGYPNLFHARAGDVLPLIAQGPPGHQGPDVFSDDYAMPGNFTGDVQLHHERIAACPAHQWLRIEVWDQS